MNENISCTVVKQTVSKLTHRGVLYLKYFGQSNLSKFMFSTDKKCLILDIHFKGKYMANTNLFHTNKINNHLFCVPKMHFSVAVHFLQNHAGKWRQFHCERTLQRAQKETHCSPTNFICSRFKHLS